MKNISSKVIKFYQGFIDSKNKAYFFLNNRKVILVILITITALLGFIGYLISSESTGLEVINNTIGLFVFAWAGDDSLLLDIAKFFAILTIFFGAIALYLSKKVNDFIVEKVAQKPYTLLIGLGTQNSNFLENLNNDTSSTITIEYDTKNPNIEYFQQKGFGIITSKAENAIDKLKLNTLKNTVISTGNDRKNIAITIKLMKALGREKEKKIFVRIENRDFRILFKQNIIKTTNGVDVIAYSLYENITKELFSRHSILGLQPEIIKNDKTYNIVLIGSSSLTVEIIYHLAILANLPEENTLNLYIIDAQAKKFYEQIKKLFTGIESIPQLVIKPIELEIDSLSFYTDKVWNKKNLTNIIITTDIEEKNLDIAINLQDTTYVNKIAKGVFKTKVLLAIYNNSGLGKEIDEDKKAFANFYAFADIGKASSQKNLIDEELDLIAKLIHNNYLSGDEVKIGNLDKKWLDKDKINQHKRSSNKAQALHIDTKLLILGIKKVKSNKTFDECLILNQEVFNKLIKVTKNSKNFPKKFDTLLSKIARAEHNRWNTFHYLHGWVHDINRDDNAKRHPCLLPFSEFKTPKLQATYQYDVNSILEIPIYLAYAGYELVFDTPQTIL